MVTEISGAGLSHSVVGQTSTALTQRVADSLRTEQVGVTPGGVDRDGKSTSTTQVTGAYAQLRSRQEVLNKAASVVRDVSNTAEKADRLLNQMEDELGEVVKMYPPYPIDNPERITLLNSFGGLRRQIDALTFPPPETLDAVGRLLGGQSDVNAEKSSETEKVSALVKEPMWDIPALDALTASDADVSKALDQVKAMKSVLEDLQAGMWKDVVSFVKQAETSESESVGSLVREQLSDLGVETGGIGRDARQLEQAAESQ